MHQANGQEDQERARHFHVYRMIAQPPITLTTSDVEKRLKCRVQSKADGSRHRGLEAGRGK